MKLISSALLIGMLLPLSGFAQDKVKNFLSVCLPKYSATVISGRHGGAVTLSVKGWTSRLW